VHDLGESGDKGETEGAGGLRDISVNKSGRNLGGNRVSRKRFEEDERAKARERECRGLKSGFEEEFSSIGSNQSNVKKEPRQRGIPE